MNPERIVILFDSHTPYLSFRVNALQRELRDRGLQDRVALEVILIGAGWSTYKWDVSELQKQYEVPVHVLSEEFHGLGLRSILHPSVPKVLWKLLWLYYRLRPRVTLVGGYDRPSSLWCRLLSYPIFGKVGVMHDSRFNDAESYSKNVWLEFIKSFVVARYSMFMVPGRECADYSRFMAGRKASVYTHAWNVVDNEGIAQAAEISDRDAEIYERLSLAPGESYFFLPARYTAKKNLPMAVQAYAQFVAKQVDASNALPSLVLCGQGPLKEELKELISRSKLEERVKLCDWLPYELVPRASRLSTAVLLPSLYDQWGMTVNEALSAGAPVLVSNRAGAHELVRNSVNGFTFSPYDQDHLAALYERLATDPQLVHSMRGQAAASMESFSVKQYVAQHLLMFRDFGVLKE